MSLSMMFSSKSPPSRICMLARTTCSFTLAVPTYLIVTVPILFIGTSCCCCCCGGAPTCAAASIPPASNPTNPKSNETTRLTGLLMIVFKAGDVSEER